MYNIYIYYGVRENAIILGIRLVLTRDLMSHSKYYSFIIIFRQIDRQTIYLRR